MFDKIIKIKTTFIEKPQLNHNWSLDYYCEYMLVFISSDLAIILCAYVFLAFPL